MDDWQNSYENFRKFIHGWCITNISLTDTTLEISAVDENSLKHTIYTAQFCEKFPEMGGTGKKRKSFEDGKMSDYWLIIYDGTELAV
jgi:hypothetical protein